jgi:hypothetical protein
MRTGKEVAMSDIRQWVDAQGRVATMSESLK